MALNVLPSNLALHYQILVRQHYQGMILRVYFGSVVSRGKAVVGHSVEKLLWAVSCEKDESHLVEIVEIDAPEGLVEEMHVMRLKV